MGKQGLCRGNYVNTRWHWITASPEPSDWHLHKRKRREIGSNSPYNSWGQDWGEELPAGEGHGTPAPAEAGTGRDGLFPGAFLGTAALPAPRSVAGLEPAGWSGVFLLF